MQRPRPAAVESVQQPFTGLCDCLKQPRRVRPAYNSSEECDVVETRPRRRIRVIHLLPTKRTKGSVNNQNLTAEVIGSNHVATGSSIFINSRTPFEVAAGQRRTLDDYSYDHFQRNGTLLAVHADIENVVERDCGEILHPEMPDYGGYDRVELGGYSQTQEREEEEADPEDDDLSEYESSVGVSPPLPVYGFESPYHPKNVADTHERLSFKLRIFADRLVHVILDEALLEYGALRELLVLPDYRCGDGERRWKTGNSDHVLFNGDGYLVQCDCPNRSPSRAIDESGEEVTKNHSTCGYCHRDQSTDELPRYCGPANGVHGWGETIALQQVQQRQREQTFYYDNPTFRSSLLGLDGSNARGESFLEQAQKTLGLQASFRISRNRSSTRLRGAGPPNGQRVIPCADDYDGPVVDPLSKFTYHPTGDDASSQHESSFPSSTWGSSTDSSVRCVWRFLSRKFKTKPLLFFVHGVGDSADLWSGQLAFFRERGYETLAMDLVGHGLSCAPNDPKAYAFHVILTDILILFDRYSKERNVVIGHSYGACFAAALARHRPKLVSHLILLSGGGPFPLCQLPSKVHLPLCLTSCVRSLLSCGTRRETFYVPSRKQARVVKNLDIPSYVLKYIRQGQVWLEGDASYHKQITVPTLLIYGLRDPYVTLVEECEMEKTIPRAFLELIPEASHMIMLDAPNQVNDMIYKFLRRWDR